MNRMQKAIACAALTGMIGGAVPAGAVCLWVEDEGPGMPEGAGASTLFERFVRAPGRQEEPEQGGMGLGLWIVRAIVERHGGAVEARREGARTRIRVTLPAAEERETA